MANYLSSTVINIAYGECGYLEKASNASLDDKYANAGDKNYTKYQRDLGHEMGGDEHPWCQSFVDWCFYKAYGDADGRELLCGSYTTNTMTCKDAFKSRGQLVYDPRPGDIWWVHRGAPEDHKGHVGIVVQLVEDECTPTSIKFITVEGNTSTDGTGGSDWNGNCVCQKTHIISVSVSGSGINFYNGSQPCWFGRPLYTGIGTISKPYSGGASFTDSDYAALLAAYGYSDVTTSRASSGSTSDSNGYWDGVKSRIFSTRTLASLFGPLGYGVEAAVDYENSFVKESVDNIGGIASSIGALATNIYKASMILADHFRNGGSPITATLDIVYETVTTEVVRDEIHTVDEDYERTKGTSLLSYPSMVEAPFIILKVGEYTFGTYTKQEINSNIVVNYPNYIVGMTVEKINGQVNRYTVNLVYKIRFGDDPSLVDRVFSSVGYGKVRISYGDYSSPTFIYKEEEVLITSLTSNVDFGNSQISYTLKCTSATVSLAANYNFFDQDTVYKPSDKIFEMLYGNNNYGLLDIFPGMANETKVKSLGLIATDDIAVELEAKQGMDPVSYINYLVSCMCSNTSDTDGVLKDSTYYMTIHDDAFGEDGLDGTYFKITKVSADTQTLSSANVYEVDIGYPSENMVMSFNLNTDNSWALLYNYTYSGGEQNPNNSDYVYMINNDGDVDTVYSPAIAISADHLKMTEQQKTWWTQMTQFPVKAELTIKGLVRSTLLMTYLRVNALFYGQRHTSSGLYVITKQVDTVDGNGYRTNLSLLRVAGDDDYIVRVKTQVTSQLPVSMTVSTNAPNNRSYLDDDRYSNENIFKQAWTDPEDDFNKSIGGGFASFFDSMFGTNAQYSGLVRAPQDTGGFIVVKSPEVYSGRWNAPAHQQYYMSDRELAAITAGCIQEQGSSIDGVEFEATLVANLYDERTKNGGTNKTYPTIYDFMMGGWFASQTHDAMRKGYDNPSSVPEHLKMRVNEIIFYGNRRNKYNEHDSVNDVYKLEFRREDASQNVILIGGKNGKDRETIRNKNDSSIWIPGVTVVYNTMGSIWVFMEFPGGNTKCDPFGYKIGDWKS